MTGGGDFLRFRCVAAFLLAIVDGTCQIDLFSGTKNEYIFPDFLYPRFFVFGLSLIIVHIVQNTCRKAVLQKPARLLIGYSVSPKKVARTLIGC